MEPLELKLRGQSPLDRQVERALENKDDNVIQSLLRGTGDWWNRTFGLGLDNQPGIQKIRELQGVVDNRIYDPAAIEILRRKNGGKLTAGMIRGAELNQVADYADRVEGSKNQRAIDLLQASPQFLKEKNVGINNERINDRADRALTLDDAFRGRKLDATIAAGQTEADLRRTRQADLYSLGMGQIDLQRHGINTNASTASEMIGANRDYHNLQLELAREQMGMQRDMYSDYINLERERSNKKSGGLGFLSALFGG